MRKLTLTTLIPTLLLLIGSISCLIPGVAFAEEEQPNEPPHFRSEGTGPDVKVEASKAAKEAKQYRGVVRKLLTVCLCGFCPGRLV